MAPQAKDVGAWSIPKGEFERGEDPLATASREFTEETGLAVADPFVSLTPVKQAGGKTVHAWAVEGDCDPAAIRSNTFSMEWPPRLGRQRESPEVDRAGGSVWRKPGNESPNASMGRLSSSVDCWEASTSSR